MTILFIKNWPEIQNREYPLWILPHLQLFLSFWFIKEKPKGWGGEGGEGGGG